MPWRKTVGLRSAKNYVFVHLKTRFEPAHLDVYRQTRFIVLDENGKRQLPIDGVRMDTLGYARARTRCARTREETV